MTPKQMYRMMRKQGISVVYLRGQWYAGDCYIMGEGISNFNVSTIHNGSQHVGPTPESAVEDYCNARNIEWDEEG